MFVISNGLLHANKDVAEEELPIMRLVVVKTKQKELCNMNPFLSAVYTYRCIYCHPIIDYSGGLRRQKNVKGTDQKREAWRSQEEKSDDVEWMMG